jgi:hypothetical protein
VAEIWLPGTGTADIVRLEGVPPDLATGVYRVEYCGPGEALLPGEGSLSLPVFRYLGAEDDADDTPAWARRPGVRYLTDREVRQIRQLRAQLRDNGKRKYTLEQLAERFGTTATTISRLTRPKGHVPVPRRRRSQVTRTHDQETGP